MESYDNTDGVFINYTQVMKVVDDKYNLAPRKQFCGARVGSDTQMTKVNQLETTHDGLTELPARSEIYYKTRLYPY